MGFFGCFGGRGLNFLSCGCNSLPSVRVENLESCSSSNSITDDQFDDRSAEKDGDLRKYKWEEIEKLTTNFSSEVIGIGGYSTVYLARFPSSSSANCKQDDHIHSRLGAVKVYNSSERLSKVVKSELDISRLLSHLNIVKLLGYCDEKDEGVLVFEYISNGTLQEKLHDSSSSTPTSLPWNTRLKIAFQLAQALEYLHDKSTLNIVHGDIKASNILLDENLNCKLCDFGFAKMGFASLILPSQRSSSSSSSSSSSRTSMMMGSPGYIDPHYLITGIASKKSDIYSFGVILLELITGIQAFSSQKEKDRMLTAFLRKNNGLDMKKVVEMVDKRLEGHFKMDEVKAMTSIAAVCLHHMPTLRPTAAEICQAMKDNVSSVSFDFHDQKCHF